jgi:general secretion pathway protein G
MWKLLRTGQERRIFFPWERRGGLFRWLALGRARAVFSVVCLAAVVLLVGARERRDAGLRQTRSTLLTLRRAVEAAIAEADGRCPERLSSAYEYAAFAEPPKDAWGRPFRLVCPGRHGEPYELMSDGPDGQPEGLDRIQ